MKKVGIVRKVDELGRIVIPIEIRRHMGVESGDPIDISYNDGKVVSSKYKSMDKQQLLLNIQRAIIEGEKDEALKLLDDYQRMK